MKKKLLTMLIIGGCILSMTACASKNENAETVVVEETEVVEQTETEPETEVEAEEEVVIEEETTEAETEVETEPEVQLANVNSELSEDLYDFQVSINGVVYQFPMWYSDFEALGWTYNGDNTQTLSSDQYTSKEYWEKDGYEVGVSFANLSMNSVTFSESMIGEIKIDEFYLRNSGWEIVLPGNIQWGVSTMEDIKDAYGEPSLEFEGKDYDTLIYSLDSYREVSLNINKETNVLGIITITNMVELEGADNSVDATAPDIAQGYVAPTSLGEDFYSYNVEFEGNLYTLPCPVSVFLANGFEIDEEKTDMELAANDIGSVRLNYNGMFFESTMINFADYATTVENCFVTSVSTYDMEGINFALVTPGNITLGSTEEEVKEAISGFNYTEDTKNTGITYYRVFPSDDKVLNDYEFGVDDGVVMSITVKNIDMPQ